MAWGQRQSRSPPADSLGAGESKNRRLHLCYCLPKGLDDGRTALEVEQEADDKGEGSSPQEVAQEGKGESRSPQEEKLEDNQTDGASGGWLRLLMQARPLWRLSKRLEMGNGSWHQKIQLQVETGCRAGGRQFETRNRARGTGLMLAGSGTDSGTGLVSAGSGTGKRLWQGRPTQEQTERQQGQPTQGLAGVLTGCCSRCRAVEDQEQAEGKRSQEVVQVG